MNNSYLLLLETVSLVSSIGLLVMSYGMRHAPLGFQHYHLFYVGEAPEGLIPVESAESAPTPASDWSV